MTEEDPVAAAAEIKRSQSSLELLSNTAAWKNVVEQQQRSLSPQESSARVSPSDQSVMNSFASSGDFRKEIGLSFDDASSLVRSPTGPASSSAPMDPTLPLLTESSHPTIVSSTTTLASSRTGSASTLTSSVSTSAWRQHLNPSIHRAFTPPLSNSRSTLLARQDTEEDSLVGTRSLHGFHHHTHHPSNNSMLPTSRQGSGDDEGEWSVGVSLESSASAQALQASPAGPADSTRHTAPDYEALQAENRELRALVLQQQSTIKDLTLEREDLLARVRELQQYPNSGKISQIPVAVMLEIMQTYGSELSDTVMPPRKSQIQKASIIRQFRRWNPNFHQFFHFKGGRWEPKLGKEGELRRRREMHRLRRGRPTSGPNTEEGGSDHPTAV